MDQKAQKISKQIWNYKMIKIVVLASVENFPWFTKPDVIPYIESCWRALDSKEFSVEILNVDAMSLTELTPRLLSAEKLVITCVNYKICKIIEYVREVLRLKLNLIIYVHNMASIAFWPFRYFGTSELFMQSDVFITASQNDRKTIESVFEGPTVHVIPFFSDIKNPSASKLHLTRPKNFVYVGRISPQNNLHSLILAYALLKRRQVNQLPGLIFFGKEDHLGSPHMNLRNDNYLQFLHKLCENLNIQNQVFFKGHVDHESIDSFLQEKSNLIISPSLHSDENFGMAVLKGLLAGNRVLISNWGGHSDFKMYFNDQVTLMPVTHSEYGPALGADTLADYAEKCLQGDEKSLSFKIDSYYLKPYFINEQKNAISHKTTPAPLKFTKLANKIYDSKIDYTTSSTQIFSGFDDPLYLELSKNYIGQEGVEPLANESALYYAVPWMDYDAGVFKITDPHKGEIQIPNDPSSQKKYSVYFNSELVVLVAKEICEKLHRNAFIYMTDSGQLTIRSNVKSYLA